MFNCGLIAEDAERAGPVSLGVADLVREHSGVEGVKVISLNLLISIPAFLSKALLNLVYFLSKIRELLVILCYITCKGAIFTHSLSFSTSFRQKTKGKMKRMKAIKHKTEKMKKIARRNRIVKLVRTPNQVISGEMWAV